MGPTIFPSSNNVSVVSVIGSIQSVDLPRPFPGLPDEMESYPSSVSYEYSMGVN